MDFKCITLRYFEILSSVWKDRTHTRVSSGLTPRIKTNTYKFEDMATSEQFPYCTDTEIQQLKKAKFTNDKIKELSEQRSQDAQKLMFNDKTFPCFTQADFEELKKKIYSMEDMKKQHQRKKEFFDQTLKKTAIAERDMKGQQFSLVVFGLEREGKSSVIKLLQNTNKTKNDTDEIFTDGNNQIREIIEAKSFLFSNKMNESTLDEIRRIGTVLQKGHCVFLLVVNSTIRRNVTFDKTIADFFQKWFGPQVLKYCVLVLTHASAGLQSESLDGHCQRIVRSGGLMAEIYEAMYPNIVAVELSDVPTYLRSCYGHNILTKIQKLMSYHQSLFQLDTDKLDLRIKQETQCLQNSFSPHSDSDKSMAPTRAGSYKRNSEINCPLL